MDILSNGSTSFTKDIEQCSLLARPACFSWLFGVDSDAIDVHAEDRSSP